MRCRSVLSLVLVLTATPVVDLKVRATYGESPADLKVRATYGESLADLKVRATDLTSQVPYVARTFRSATATAAQRRSAEPNIVLILMDDLGYGDLGSYGAPDAKTPNIDSLAREGVKLPNFYANGATCSPTRTALITGRYQQRAGIETPIRIAETSRGLVATANSLPTLLSSRGYATGLIGKWHLGTQPEHAPRRHGFDEFWGFLGGWIDYYSHGAMAPDAEGVVDRDRLTADLFHNETRVTSKGYLTDEITAHATAFIDAHRDRPFFLEVSYNATHWPFQAPDAAPDKRGYRNVLRDGTRADYVAMLERADRGVGEILNLLERRQLARNTLVIFTSDNGGEWLSRNAPFFHRKSTLWEGGIRVPLLMRWPDRLRPATTSRQVGITMDLTATILAAAGVPAPTAREADGIDLLPLIEQGKTAERTLFWRVSATGRDQRAVRRGRWKYLRDGISGVEGVHEFIFDLEADPGERNDLVMSQPALLKELRALAANWEREVDADAKRTSSSQKPDDVVITTSLHSSIQLEHGGKVIQIDPWSLGDLSKLKPADLILITDDVGHHLDVKAIARLRKPGAPVVIAANGVKQVPDGIVMANGESREIAGVRIEATPAYDVTPGVSFHPKGEANGYIVTLGSQRIYIVGVTECVPEIRAARSIDVAFFPLNLPAARMEPAAAAECLKAFKPKVVYPYHYDQDYVTQLTRGTAKGPASTRGLQELTDALKGEPIEVRLVDWYAVR